MRATTEELNDLLELQRLLLEQRRILAEAGELTKGGKLEQLRLELAESSESLSAARLENEELRRELRRQESDLELVEKRISQDQKRLVESSSTKDIAGIQHELETLARRKSELEDLELGLMEELEASDRKMHEIETLRESKEGEIETAKAEISVQLAELKLENQKLVGGIEQLKSELNQDLIKLFEQKFARGVAVGRLHGSSCSACNMSLNSQAMAEIAKVHVEELATCPECASMLVRG